MSRLKANTRALNGQDRARLAQERAKKPERANMRELIPAFNEIAASRAAKDKSMLPECYYDHVNDRAYVLLVDPDTGDRLTSYRAVDMIDHIPAANRKQRTVED